MCSNGWLHQGCSSAPLGAAIRKYSEKRQMHPLHKLYQIRCKRPELQPGLAIMPCLPPSPACLLGVRGKGELHIYTQAFVSRIIQSDK
jgi:hypothetical protein